MGNVANVSENQPNFTGFAYEIRWSADPNLTTTDPQIATVWTGRLKPGESVPFKLTLQAPPNSAAGTHYVGICPPKYSPYLQQATCTVVPVFVSSTSSIDLRVTDVSLGATRAQAGDSIAVSFVISNDGNTTAGSASHAIRWSADPDDSVNGLAMRQIRSGGPNGGTAVGIGPFRVQVPATATTGVYHIAVCADSTRSVPETDDTNNCAIVPLSVFNPGGPQTVSLSVDPFTARSTSTPGSGATPVAGYAMIVSETGPRPYGAAVLTLRQNGVTVSEVGVPPSPPTTAARVFMGIKSGFINSGVAIANPGSVDASLTLDPPKPRRAPARTATAPRTPGWQKLKSNRNFRLTFFAALSVRQAPRSSPGPGPLRPQLKLLQLPRLDRRATSPNIFGAP